jgi:hypothetical protein
MSDTTDACELTLGDDRGEVASGLSYAFAAVIAELNERWRVRDDPLQWILERRAGNQWLARSFCRTKAGLKRCVREYCGVVDAVAAT